jgi:FdhD protein
MPPRLWNAAPLFKAAVAATRGQAIDILEERRLTKLHDDTAADVTFRTIAVTRVRGSLQNRATDWASVEEPLEVRLHGRPFSVIMRTPGADRELAAGFLFAERILKSADDLGTIDYCTDPTTEHPENIVNVTLTEPAAGDVEQMLGERRQVTTTSSCGLCGRLTIESLITNGPPLTSGWTLDRAVLSQLPGRLRAAQKTFESTGGLHGAGLFTPEGRLVESSEDVGRHNAVDKIVGRMLMREALPLSDYVLFVSGRTSYEILQKAFLAGIPIVAAVSAPSTLAVDLAHEIGITLIGFVRGDGFNIYTHPERVTF